MILGRSRRYVKTSLENSERQGGQRESEWLWRHPVVWATLLDCAFADHLAAGVDRTGLAGQIILDLDRHYFDCPGDWLFGLSLVA